MEYVAPKPFKHSSNISDIVSKFAKVCKLRSVGVFSSENPDPDHRDYNVPNSNDALTAPLDEAQFHPEKIYPQLDELNNNGCKVDEIPNVFKIVSALKWAYVQLQNAHIPYKPERIIAADELFMAQLQALCKIKRAYKKRKLEEIKPNNNSQVDMLVTETKAVEKLLGELNSKLKSRNSEVLCLRREFEDLALENKKLIDETRQMSLERKKERVLSIVTFHDTIRAVSEAIHDFAKPLISLMKASGWNLDMAAESIESAVVYSKRSDKKYAFEAYIARRMFHGLSFKSCNVDEVMRFNDPLNAFMENPNSEFAKFCAKKYLLVVHPTMEASFFGNLDHRTLVLGGMHPRTHFYQIFAKMAKWIWVLQGIATSIDPKATLFAVRRGSQFSDIYMESVKQDNVVDDVRGRRTVGFMIMPGFKIGAMIVKSHVYVSK